MTLPAPGESIPIRWRSSVGGGDTDLEEPRRFIGADEHDQIIEFEHSNGIALGVDHVLVADGGVPSSARKNHGLHHLKLP